MLNLCHKTVFLAFFLENNNNVSRELPVFTLKQVEIEIKFESFQTGLVFAVVHREDKNYFTTNGLSFSPQMVLHDLTMVPSNHAYTAQLSKAV